MGAAKEHRDIAAAQRMFDSERKERENTNFAKAQWWRDLMQEGHILTFRTCGGKTITAGPYRVAIPGSFSPGFAVIGLPGKEIQGGAWGVALRVVEYCGRVKPYLIDGQKTN